MRALTFLVAVLLLATAVGAGVPEKKNSALPSDCGRFLNFKFFVGNRTEFDDYPWLVLLEYNTPRGRRLSCGGVLLSKRHVLTAAHCVANLGENWTLDAVRVGEYDTDTVKDCLPDGNKENTSTCIPEAQSIKIAEQLVHDGYGKGGQGHDIALLKLAEDIPESDFVKPVCLASKPPIPQRFHAAGWGRLARRPGTSIKYRTYLSTVNDTTCKSWYNSRTTTLLSDQMCAGGASSEKPCTADSGGPLMGVEKLDDGNHRMAVFGILTMDSRLCDVKGQPGLYTQVLPHRDWILSHIK